MTKPLLLLDVDGVLNPYCADVAPEGYETYYINLQDATFKVYLNPSHGKKLLSLGYDLMWATAWEDDANKFLSPKLGLPDLPVIHFSRSFSTRDYRLYFKTETIVREMNLLGRPYVWIDDEVTRHDKSFMRLNSTTPCDTLTINPSRGLTTVVFEELKRIHSSYMALEGSQSDSKPLSAPAGYGESLEGLQGPYEAPTALEMGRIANPMRMRV